MFVYSDFYSIGKESYRRNISVLQLRVENGKNLLCGVGISLPKFQSQNLIRTKYMHTLKGRQLSSVIIQNVEDRQAS
jgi:hypothetical protein